MVDETDKIEIEVRIMKDKGIKDRLERDLLSKKNRMTRANLFSMATWKELARIKGNRERKRK